MRVHLIDQKERVRGIYSFGTFNLRLAVTDVRTLLLKEKAWRQAGTLVGTTGGRRQNFLAESELFSRTIS